MLATPGPQCCASPCTQHLLRRGALKRPPSVLSSATPHPQHSRARQCTQRHWIPRHALGLAALLTLMLITLSSSARAGPAGSCIPCFTSTFTFSMYFCTESEHHMSAVREVGCAVKPKLALHGRGWAEWPPA